MWHRLQDILEKSPQIEALASEQQSISAEQLAMAWTESLKVSKIAGSKLIVVNGMAHPASILRLFEESEPETHFALVEADPLVFLASFYHKDWEPLFKSARVEFFVGLEVNQFVAAQKEFFLQEDRLVYREAIGQFYCTKSLQAHGPFYVEFSKAMQVALKQLGNHLEAPGEDGYRGLINVIGNLSCLKKTFDPSCLQGSLQGLPAVIVSTGPSLQFHLDQLKANQDRFVIACSDSSLKFLLNHNIKPHFVMSMERTKNIVDVLGDLPADLDIPLVTLPVCYPTVIKNYPGPKIFLNRGSSFGKWLWPEADFFNLGNSVATMAYRFFVYLGVSEINLLGQDLAFAPDLKSSHFAAVEGDIQKVELSRISGERSAVIPGNSGHDIQSTTYWKSFRDQLDAFIAKFSIPTRNVIPTSYGAQIQQAERVDPEMFWQEAAKRTAIKSIDFGFRDAQNQRDCGELVDQSKKDLRDLNKKTLQVMNDLSLTIHEDFPQAGKTEKLEAYRAYFKVWEQKRQALVNEHRSLFKNLLSPLLASHHYAILTQRERVRLQDENFLSAVSQYFDLTQAWLKECHYWSSRVLDLLEGAETSE
ncbi:MAG: motility associated factor glycosyltransferase family protein [Deltaproteobacteria bacterium]|nr:motility associated factor glycosyltransferase family protein [Deltaproteobacteria bacterium]